MAGLEARRRKPLVYAWDLQPGADDVTGKGIWLEKGAQDQTEARRRPAGWQRGGVAADEGGAEGELDHIK